VQARAAQLSMAVTKLQYDITAARVGTEPFVVELVPSTELAERINDFLNACGRDSESEA